MEFNEIEFWRWVVMAIVLSPVALVLSLLTLAIIGQVLMFVVLPMFWLFMEFTEIIENKLVGRK